MHGMLQVCCWTPAAQPAWPSVMHTPAKVQDTAQHTPRPPPNRAPNSVLHLNCCCCCRTVSATRTSKTHMLKQPVHFTSMKKLLGDWTSLLSLCLVLSSSAGGLSRSISLWSTCRQKQPLISS